MHLFIFNTNELKKLFRFLLVPSSQDPVNSELPGDCAAVVASRFKLLEDSVFAQRPTFFFPLLLDLEVLIHGTTVDMEALTSSVQSR